VGDGLDRVGRLLLFHPRRWFVAALVGETQAARDDFHSYMTRIPPLTDNANKRTERHLKEHARPPNP